MWKPQFEEVVTGFGEAAAAVEVERTPVLGLDDHLELRGALGDRIPLRPLEELAADSLGFVLRADEQLVDADDLAASLALLDATRSGVVVTAIQGRDYARIYMKELDRGRPSLALSPEEQEAVERAMAY